MKKSLLIILFLFSAVMACSKKAENPELKYTIDQFTNLAHETSPSKEKGEGALKFSDYAPGANHVESQALTYKRLTFFAISFDTPELAQAEALRLNQYCARNWLFDRVEGEPLLEDYVIETFKGINPKRKIQRVPKKHVDEHEKHGEVQGEGHEANHEAAPAAHH